MAKKILMLLIPLFFLSCNQIVPSLRVFQGNYRSRQGNYQHAEVDYLKALEEDLYPQWINYNQGNIYYSLGETESALRAWQMSETLEDEELQFRLSFNRGVLYYDQGDYKSAYNQFKQALRINPSNVDCKINLELTIKKIGGHRSDPSISPEQGETLMDDTERLLYFIESKELYQWESPQEDNPTLQQDW